ncbi:hypothetical protein AVEN_273527-1 [Araneus ventricosus]|uniref:Uncharacterized protein n=1 Tax=Araneus ventricosus TaxID=182803 RepID=A0A4Y2H4X3_ARAVE|nr:hypothetical protein AVEN_273527-1 [Araneus ventricosus]
MEIIRNPCQSISSDAKNIMQLYNEFMLPNSIESLRDVQQSCYTVMSRSKVLNIPDGLGKVQYLIYGDVASSKTKLLFRKKISLVQKKVKSN